MLRHMWNDIRKGENIDLYLTIVAALVFVVLNLVGVASPTFLAPLSLAVLGLLAITNLGNRQRMEELLAQKALTLDDFFREEYPATYQDNLDQAAELWLVGVSLNRTVKSHYLKLEQKLRRGGSCHPDASNGAIYLEHYTFRVTTESYPRYMLRTQDGEWYDFFKAELRTL